MKKHKPTPQQKHQQEQYIHTHYLHKPIKTIAREINRSHCYVTGYMKRHNLIVPPHIIQARKKASQFNKKHTPFNKGIPMSQWMPPEKIKKLRKTQFKKGNIPHNTKTDHHISLRKDSKGYEYYYIRIKKSHWELYHRYLWEQAHGPIPPDHNIQFKDGNQLNCQLDNLYQVEKQYQAVHNHHGGNKLPHEIKQTLTLISKLNKTIK